MPTQVLGSETFLVTPTVNSDPVMVAIAGGVPSILSGSGSPTSTPVYGAGSMYVDITNYQLYIYQSSTWQLLSDNITLFSVSTPTTAANGINFQYVYLVSGTTTITLPTAVSNINSYTIKNVGAGTVTLATTSAQTIDGSTTASLPVRYTSLTVVSDGANWYII